MAKKRKPPAQIVRLPVATAKIDDATLEAIARKPNKTIQESILLVKINHDRKQRRKQRSEAAKSKNKTFLDERPFYQGKIDFYMSVEGGRLSYHAACELAAERDFQAAPGTIKSHTVNKKPQNRGLRGKRKR